MWHHQARGAATWPPEAEGSDLDARSTYEELRLVTEFTVTEDHLKLLRRAYAGWDDCEFGAPAIDCKRPYGNSDVIGDIAEILGVETNDEGDVSPDENARLIRLHGETATVLQIALATGEFRAGRYACDKYQSNWRPVALSRADELRQSAREAFAAGQITQADLDDRLGRIAVMERQDRDAGN
jgi:hypothetical protein